MMTAPAPVPLKRHTPLYSTHQSWGGVYGECEACCWRTRVFRDGRFLAPTFSSHGRVLGDPHDDLSIPACTELDQEAAR